MGYILASMRTLCACASPIFFYLCFCSQGFTRFSALQLCANKHNYFFAVFRFASLNVKPFLH